MPQGSVAWYDTDKGFGFLTPDDGSPDVFVHVSEVEGGQPLQEGEPVAFDVRQGDRGPQAVGVRPLDGGSAGSGSAGSSSAGSSSAGSGAAAPGRDRADGRGQHSPARPRQAAGGRQSGSPGQAARSRPAADPVYGTVTFFAEDKGFGFVAPDGGGPDVFVHVSAVEEAVQLRDGDRVELEVRQGDRGPQGERVRLLADDADETGDGVWMQGTVSWYSPDKGFGFLVPDDLFVHGSAVTGAAQLREGERVAFEVRLGDRGPQAEQVRVVGAAAERPRPAQEQQERLAGTVARYDGDRGFGFLTPDDGSGDVFVHVSALSGDGARGLAEGERVEFDVVQGPRGPQAADVRRAP